MAQPADHSRLGIPSEFLKPLDPRETITGNQTVPVYAVAGSGTEEETVELFLPSSGLTMAVTKDRLFNQTKDLPGRVVGIALMKRGRFYKIKGLNNNLTGKAHMIDSCLKANSEWVQRLPEKENLLAHCKDLNTRIVASLAKHQLKDEKMIQAYRRAYPHAAALSNKEVTQRMIAILSNQAEGWKDLGDLIHRTTGRRVSMVELSTFEEPMPAAQPAAVAAAPVIQREGTFDKFLAVLSKPRTRETLDEFEGIMKGLENADDLPRYKEFFEKRRAEVGPNTMLDELIAQVDQIEASRAG